jgi:hypothetical protein
LLAAVGALRYRDTLALYQQEMLIVKAPMTSMPVVSPLLCGAHCEQHKQQPLPLMEHPNVQMINSDGTAVVAVAPVRGAGCHCDLEGQPIGSQAGRRHTVDRRTAAVAGA